MTSVLPASLIVSVQISTALGALPGSLSPTLPADFNGSNSFFSAALCQAAEKQQINITKALGLKADERDY